MSTESDGKTRRSRFSKKKVNSRPRISQKLDAKKSSKFSTRKIKGF